jgi:uncharacterized protein (DUF849 family)
VQSIQMQSIYLREAECAALRARLEEFAHLLERRMHEFSDAGKFSNAPSHERLRALTAKSVEELDAEMMKASAARR